MPLVTLTDPADKRLRPYSGMTDAQLKECFTSKSGDKTGAFAAYPNGLFIAESKNVITRALDAGYPLVSLFVEERWFDHERALVERVLKDFPDADVLRVSHDTFKTVTGYQVTRGALAAFERRPVLDLREILAKSRRVAVIEDVTNYTNMGAIFRSAAALGIDAVLVTPGCHDPLYRRASRVSMGTVFQVPWTRIGKDSDWAKGGVELLHEFGFTVLAFALEEDSLSLRDPELKGLDRAAIVLGTEGEGLRASTIAACDHTVLIPMHNKVDSLNVAAASAVAFWELCD